MAKYNTVLPDGTRVELQADNMKSALAEKAQLLREFSRQQEPGNKGAPANVRAAVGASRGPGAQLQALQGFYPDARRVDGRLVYDDPSPQYMNPQGFDIGDIAEYGRVGAEMLGTAIGGSAGLTLGGGATAGLGAIPGAMSGAAAGNELAGYLYDKGMDLFGRKDTRDVQETAGDMVKSALFASTGTPAGRLTKSGAPLLDNVIAAKDVGRTAIDKAASEAGISGMTPGQRGGVFAQKVEAGLESIPSSAPTMVAQRGKVLNELGSYVDETFPPVGTRENIGGRMVESVRHVIPEKRASESKLFDAIEGSFNQQGNSISSRIPIENLKQVRKRVDGMIKRDPDFGPLVYNDPDVSAYLRAASEAEKGGRAPTYEVIKRIRTAVGRKMDDAFLTAGGGDKAQLKEMYSVLSRDLDDAAVMLGGDAGSQARGRANWYSRGLARRLESIDDVFKFADNPTKVFTTMSNMAVNNPSSLASVKKTLPKNVWDDFVNTYLQGATRAKPGVQDATGTLMSPATTTTNLSRLRQQSPEGFSLLFEGREKAVDNIITLSDALKQSEKYFNRSNTAGALAAGQMVTGAGSGAAMGYMMGGPVMAGALATTSVMSTTVIPWLTSKFMTSKSLSNAVGSISAETMAGIRSTSDLARALAAAGADESTINELQSLETIE